MTRRARRAARPALASRGAFDGKRPRLRPERTRGIRRSGVRSSRAAVSFPPCFAMVKRPPVSFPRVPSARRRAGDTHPTRARDPTPSMMCLQNPEWCARSRRLGTRRAHPRRWDARARARDPDARPPFSPVASVPFRSRRAAPAPSPPRRRPRPSTPPVRAPLPRSAFRTTSSTGACRTTAACTASTRMISDPAAAVFHVCPASWFHGQLPVGFGREVRLRGFPPSRRRRGVREPRGAARARQREPRGAARVLLRRPDRREAAAGGGEGGRRKIVPGRRRGEAKETR